jgi:hypothetical protein
MEAGPTRLDRTLSTKIRGDYPRPLSAYEREQSRRQRRLTLYLLLAIVVLLLMIISGLWAQIGG